MAAQSVGCAMETRFAPVIRTQVGFTCSKFRTDWVTPCSSSTARIEPIPSWPRHYPVRELTGDWRERWTCAAVQPELVPHQPCQNRLGAFWHRNHRSDEPAHARLTLATLTPIRFGISFHDIPLALSSTASSLWNTTGGRPSRISTSGSIYPRPIQSRPCPQIAGR